MEKLRRNKDQRTQPGDSQDKTISSMASINYGGKLKLLMMATLLWALVVGSSVVVVVVEAVGLAVATSLAFDCEDALPTAIITNKINFIT